MIRNITCTVNSKPITWQIDVRMSLADVLRTNGFTSVKEGCGVGECGACAVLIDDVAVDSCLYLAVWADGRNIRTTEGESKEGTLSQVQQAYLDHQTCAMQMPNGKARGLCSVIAQPYEPAHLARPHPVERGHRLPTDFH